MGYEAENRQTLIDYMRSGCKGGDLGRIGVEQEHFIVDEDGESVPYEGYNGRLGVRDILERLSEYWPQKSRNEAGDLLGLARPASNITLEPSAQVELSIAPMLTVAQVEEEYRAFVFRMEQILKPVDYRMVAYGYRPDKPALDMPLIPKKRYELMDGYMRAIPGMRPERMMRGSASLQVSIDFASEEDAVLKARIATLLGPVLALLADNTPVFEGKPNAQALRRLELWRHVDPDRCGAIHGLFDEGFGFGAYVDGMLAANPIFITRGGDHLVGGQTAAQAYADAPMDANDVDHLFSMFWPDVRLKRYVEIRPADALPTAPMLGYVALVKGLFYGSANVELLAHFLKLDAPGALPYTDATVDEAIKAVIADGYDAELYGRTVGSWVDLLLRLASEGLGTEFGYLEALKEFKGL